MPGAFVISLDFELDWGRNSSREPSPFELRSYLGERRAIAAMLTTFEKHQISATWAIVGCLFAGSKSELAKYAPTRWPPYESTEGDLFLRRIGESETDDPLHYAESVVRQIAAFPGQEIATHTFSHYCCFERGQDVSGFADDLASAIKIAAAKGFRLESMVFPRNQVNPSCLPYLRAAGIRVIRGPQTGWMYEPSRIETSARRLSRLIDTYVNAAGDGTYRWHEIVRPDGLSDVRASRFLRPFSPSLQSLERFRLTRIVKALQTAAERKRVFHLWWHPHNFGCYTERSLALLNAVLHEFADLRRTHGMLSLSMRDAAALAGADVV